MQCLQKNKLTENSHPSDWFSALLPDKRVLDQPNHLVSIADWTTFSNKRAMLANAGPGGIIYPDFKPFTLEEVKKFVALYILQGLSPSLQIKQKFKPQHEDPVNGNNLCHKVFTRSGERKQKMFNAFFSCQDPMKITSQRKADPNFKVDNLLAHLQSISMEAWVLAAEFLCLRTSKQLVSKETMQISSESHTREKEMAF